MRKTLAVTLGTKRKTITIMTGTLVSKPLSAPSSKLEQILTCELEEPTAPPLSASNGRAVAEALESVGASLDDVVADAEIRDRRGSQGGHRPAEVGGVGAGRAALTYRVCCSGASSRQILIRY